MRNNFVKEYLSFSKKERNGIFILLSIIILCLVAPFLYPYFIKHKNYDHSAFDKEISQLKMQLADSSSGKKYYSKNFDRDSYQDNYNKYHQPLESNYINTTSELFYFDPNTASANDWKRLGVKDKTIATIQKYISKGGHFYKPEDLRKIWGINTQLQSRLIPYVQIANKQKQYSNSYNNQTDKPSAYTFTNKKPVLKTVDINLSDTSSFISLPGIGSKLAQRIITFREKLGGFYSVEQVKETYGLPDSTYIKIKPKLVLSNSAVKQININTASLEELKSHPYIRYNLANAFIQYRNQHGNFSSVADIKKIMIITDDVFNKVSPYLTIN
jgi:competence ComEA-like helix-hairpin-helix protein